MEVGDYVVSVMQVQVTVVEAERQAGQTTDPEHGQERHHEQHRRVETN